MRTDRRGHPAAETWARGDKWPSDRPAPESPQGIVQPGQVVASPALCPEHRKVPDAKNQAVSASPSFLKSPAVGELGAFPLPP